MSRTLNDDFDEDDLPGGSLDLEKGSAQVGGGAPSSYGSDGIDFDDELYGDAGGGGALELDLPGKPGPGPSAHAPQASHAPPASSPSLPAGGPIVPDLAFDATPRGSVPAARTSGTHPAALQSGQRPAAMPSHAPSSSRSLPAPAPPPPPSEGGNHGFAPAPSSSGRGFPVDDSGPQSLDGHAPAAQVQPPGPPPKPTAAAVIAKYPDAPAQITQAPMYAIRVVLRQLELRTDLESLRRRRSPDVPLYEAALKAYDAKTFRLGMAINCAALAVATFIFFLPVMIRFLRAD